MKKIIFATTAAAFSIASVYAMSERPEGNANTPVAVATSQSQTELEHRVATLQTGMLAMESSKVAMQKSGNPVIKQFAQAEIDEQTTMAEVFKSIYPSAPSVALTGADAEKLANLKNASGAKFNAMYVDMQIEGHNKLLDIQNDYIGSAKNREELNVAKVARGQIREHIMLLNAFKQHAK